VRILDISRGPGRAISMIAFIVEECTVIIIAL